MHGTGAAGIVSKGVADDAHVNETTTGWPALQRTETHLRTHMHGWMRLIESKGSPRLGMKMQTRVYGGL